jgi:hypothetical protein
MQNLNKRKLIIRFLAIIGLLIFFLPFFQACSDDTIKSSSSFFRSNHNAETDTEKEITFEKTKKDLTLSGYDLAMLFEPVMYGFTTIMIINITLLVCFFRNHYNQLILCFINLLIIFSSILIMVFTLSGLGQIRYGMYLCLINSTLLFYFVYKEQENSI